jgi:IS5 family transposase
LSFKKFLGLSFSKASPDHSTFSRFRAPPPADQRSHGSDQLRNSSPV